MEYYEFENSENIESVEDLQLHRSIKLHSALLQNSDFEIIQIFRVNSDSGDTQEAFIVDVQCDEVPPNNAFGLRFRERLAIKVPFDNDRLVEVFPLRKDFPGQLMHQNQAAPGEPRSLCLYFEPIKSIHRTWTPQKFLRRIQWWIEKSASGQLHAADQPAEQLFFTPIHELILPWNFHTLTEGKSKNIFLTYKEVRKNNALTFFATPVTQSDDVLKNHLPFLILTLPVTPHGVLENLPCNLDELIEILKTRNIEFTPILKEGIKNMVGEDGVVFDRNKKALSVILINVPVSKNSIDIKIDSINRYAFFVSFSIYKLGVILNALIYSEEQKKYFRSIQIGFEEEEMLVDKEVLRNISLHWVEVLYCNDQTAFRAQSGISSDGPKGVFIGAGALGSSILNLWSRCGWGTWTVIDKDHIRPHNLTRHLAFNCHIGEYKAEVAVHQHNLIADGSSDMKALVEDATDFSNLKLTEAISSADLVIDCTTTLEYPRASSENDGFPRHVSVFLTPNGNNSVLMAENSDRSVTLRTLEAQYYRAIIQNDWGRQHLDGNMGNYWSGASCRDISLVLPYSSVMYSASVLSEQIPFSQENHRAQIKIWERDRQKGETRVRAIATHREKMFSFGDFRLYLDEGLEFQLQEFRQRSLPNETGGVLLGYYDLNLQIVVIVEALRAPDDSKSTPSEFSRGTRGVLDTINEASNRTAGVVQYVGEWHSHPDGFSSSPSNEDLIQLLALAEGMSRDGLPAVQIIVGEKGLNVLQASI